MGRMHITLDDIINYLKSDINKYSEEQQFLDEFYKIGFKNRAHDVLDQNIDKYPKINFEYDDLKNIDLHLLNTNFQTFLNNNEPFDDVLFDIAENHYEAFKKLSSDYQIIFDMVKESFRNDIDHEALINKIDEKIDELYNLRRIQIDGQKKLTSVFNDDISKFIEEKYSLRNNYSNDRMRWILREFQNIEKDTNYFFKKDAQRTLLFFQETINKYQELKEVIINNSGSLDKDSYSDEMSYKEVEASMMYSANEPLEEENSKEKFEIFSFDKLSNTISKNMEIDLNKDIYINFLALNRIEEHYKDIYNLKHNIGSILES